MSYEPHERAPSVAQLLAAWAVCGAIAAIALGLVGEDPLAAFDLPAGGSPANEAAGLPPVRAPGFYQCQADDRLSHAAPMAIGTAHSG